MASSAGDLDPKCTPEHNASVFVKAAKRFRQILADYKERDQPMAIKAWKILPSPLNRLGAPLNIQYIHNGLASNVHKKGYDPARPKPGVVIRRTNADKLKRLKEHALAMVSPTPRLFPPMHVDSPECCYECAGGNHLTTMIKMYEAKMTSDITHMTFHVPVDDKDLADVVDSGHIYYILRDDIPDADVEFLSEYLNSDQNENQCTSEISTLAQVDRAITKELVKTPHPKVSTIVKIVSGESMLKLRPDSIGDMAHFCINLAGTDAIKQLLAWHGRYIDPREMSISHRWLGDVAKIVGKPYPLVLMGLTFCQYRGEHKVVQTRPNPDISRSIGLPELNAMMKNIEQLRSTEEFLRDTIKMFEETFKNKLISKDTSNMMFNWLQEAAARLLLSKDLNLEFDHKVSGKWTYPKLEELRKFWVKHIEYAFKDQLDGLQEDFGLAPEDEKAEPAGQEEVLMISIT
eukprot:1778600-Karenia_brevis.AAC.1